MASFPGMIDRAAAAAWVLRYVNAWASNDPDDIGNLFSAEAHYLTQPWAEPWVGRDGIVNRWLEIADEPGSWDFSFEVVGVDGRLAFVEGTTDYSKSVDRPRVYRNLWVIEFDGDGRCSRFTEWYMKMPEKR